MLLDPDDPFFSKPWRGIVIVAALLAWAAFEFATGSAFWGVLFGSAGLWVGWTLSQRSTDSNEK